MDEEASLTDEDEVKQDEMKVSSSSSDQDDTSTNICKYSVNSRAIIKK